MNRTASIVLLFSAVIFALPMQSMASSIIWQDTFTHAGGHASLNQPASTVFRISSNSLLTTDHRSSIFSGITLTPASVGTTFTINASNDAGFTSTVAYFTDGIDDWAGHEFSNFTGFFGSESSFFWWSSPGSTAVDLHGFQIDYFTMKMTDYSFASPGSDPNHNGIWTDYRLRVDVAAYGSLIPEPSSFFLAGIAGIGLVAMARRRRAS